MQWILHSLSCIPDSNARESGFHNENLMDSRFHKWRGMTTWYYMNSKFLVIPSSVIIFLLSKKINKCACPRCGEHYLKITRHPIFSWKRRHYARRPVRIWKSNDIAQFVMIFENFSRVKCWSSVSKVQIKRKENVFLVYVIKRKVSFLPV